MTFPNLSSFWKHKIRSPFKRMKRFQSKLALRNDNFSHPKKDTSNLSIYFKILNVMCTVMFNMYTCIHYVQTWMPCTFQMILVEVDVVNKLYDMAWCGSFIITRISKSNKEKGVLSFLDSFTPKQYERKQTKFHEIFNYTNTPIRLWNKNRNQVKFD